MQLVALVVPAYVLDVSEVSWHPNVFLLKLPSFPFLRFLARRVPRGATFRFSTTANVSTAAGHTDRQRRERRTRMRDGGGAVRNSWGGLLLAVLASLFPPSLTLHQLVANDRGERGRFLIASKVQPGRTVVRLEGVEEVAWTAVEEVVVDFLLPHQSTGLRLENGSMFLWTAHHTAKIIIASSC